MKSDNLGGRHKAERKHLGTILFGTNTLYINKFVYTIAVYIEYNILTRGCLLPRSDGMVFMKELWPLKGTLFGKKPLTGNAWRANEGCVCICVIQKPLCWGRMWQRAVKEEKGGVLVEKCKRILHDRDYR